MHKNSDFFSAAALSPSRALVGSFIFFLAVSLLLWPVLASQAAFGLPDCIDGIDNDGDLLVDFPADPGCTSPFDNDEFNAPPPPPNATLELVCELKVGATDEDQRVAKSLHLETYNADPNLPIIWSSLFGTEPETSVGDALTLQSDQTVIWPAGGLTMGGVMKVKVKTDKKDPSLKNVQLEKAGKKEGVTSFISGSGGVKPNLADGGWHEVKVKNMDNITVSFDGESVTGFLKELKVKLDKDSTTGSPVVKDFKIKIKGATTAADVKKGTVNSVSLSLPATIVTASGSTLYDEKIKDSPEILSGHTEAEYERESDTLSEGVDISSLADGFSDQLKERKGPCLVTSL